jgi:CRP-like cAMP-binding protein
MSARGADRSVGELAQIVLFADLSVPELREIDHILEEEFYDEGRRILRRGIEGSNFYVIVEGEAATVVDDVERARLSTGDYFGEMSLLLGESPDTDVTALTPLRCRVLAGIHFERFLLEHPHVLYRMLQAQTLRLHSVNQWHE